MDLFTYLMSKNEKYLSIHGDLFSYLLGKSQSGGEIKTVSGITITIPDAKKTNLVSFMMTKESTQEGIPTPDNPVPVNVVEGYRNLFDKSQGTTGKYLDNSGNEQSSSGWMISDYISVIPNNEYTYNGLSDVGSAPYSVYYDENKTFISSFKQQTGTNTITIPSTAYYIIFSLRRAEQFPDRNDFIIYKGNQQLPYVPYGNNYILYKQVGKNLYKPYFWQRTNNGIDFTHNLDGSINVDKTSTASAYSLNSSQAISNNFTFILNPGTYTLSGGKTNIYINLTNLEGTNIATTSSNKLSTTFTLSEKTECFLRAQVSSGNTYNNEKIYPLLEVGSEATEYEAYKEINVPIPLNNNIIVGIGDYKDELKVDKSGNVSIEKNTAKIDSYNGETITTPYMSTTGGLDIGATVYYGIDTPVIIDLQTTVDIELFKGINNISNSEDGYMTIEYQ